jgi:hypothetical protein
MNILMSHNIMDYPYHFDSVDDIKLLDNSTYFFSYSHDECCEIVNNLKKKYSGICRFIEFNEFSKNEFIEKNTKRTFHYRDFDSISEMINQYKNESLYIDISGLDCKICASIFKAISNSKVFKNIFVLYTEPELYKMNEFDQEGVFNHLSERISGIEPLPGFASIIPHEDDDILFIPLLGFEGGRFKYIVDNIQPPEEIIPIIGCPGFRIEYPFYTFWNNWRALEKYDSWPSVKFAPANSCIDAYVEIEKIHKKRESYFLKIAIIGTKPHAIGAILYALNNPIRTELIYDNPVRTRRRSDGIGKITLSRINNILQVI